MAAKRRSSSPSGQAKRRRTHKKKRTNFFSLPAEVRNQIYAYALVARKEIAVTPHLHEPDLLSTSRQIRFEARKFYYRNNTFRVPVRNCDAALLVKFNKFLIQFGDGEGSVRLLMKLTGRKNWANVLAWCEQIHTQRLNTWYWCRPKTPMETVIEAAHKIVRNGGLSWERCKEGLDALGDTIGKYDAAWMRKD
ncbi:Hypothetical predicted protein [Lecanosticta acicola]|uniref:Uncharacterized protein n=1 Tax=Lecanosticta acicola TaxID=111012 RepID=A0AAI8YR73_9PEZI|nr:Hypothetical predicted protein [Lecanosticta acicola]